MLTFWNKRTTRAAMILWIVIAMLGCDGSSIGNAPISNTPEAKGNVAVAPTDVPFDVRGDLDGLIVTWFDAQGVHNVSKRSEVPEHRRAQVRIDSLAIAPDKRLDPTLVYIADVRAALPDGSYPVRTMERAAFDALVDKTAGIALNLPQQADPQTDTAPDDNADPNAVAADNADKPVVIYKASWCGACKATAAFLRSRGVEFVERDVEKDRGAQQEMQQKARAAGVSPRGVPVIDFRGTIVLGFDKAQLNRLIERKYI